MSPVDGPEAYPQARNAIRLFERCVKTLPDLMPVLRGLPVERAIAILIQSVRLEVDACGTQIAEECAIALPEYATADFRRYLLAVVYGAM